MDRRDVALHWRRPLAICFVAFTAAWIAFVIMLWKLQLVPDAARPWLRNAFWIGAAAIWVAWRRPPERRRWMGLWPITLRQAGLALAAFGLIVSWNLLRVHVLASPLGKLAAATPISLAWGFVGVFAEELLFRGVIQTQIAEGTRIAWAILVTTILFLAIHIPGWIILAIPIGAPEVATVFLVGVICGILRAWSQSLWPAVFAHWANNLGAMI